MADDLRRYDWQTRLADHPQKACYSYCNVFVACGEKCRVENDDLGLRVYSLLAMVASFHPNYDARENAYGPMFRNSDGSRALMAEDLTDVDLEALRGILDEIVDPEFRARVGDVLWESTRDHKAARTAVQAFIQSAELYKNPEHWPSYAERVGRAAQLAAKLGFGQALHKNVISTIEAVIKEFESNLNSGLMCHSLMVIILDHGDAHSVYYAGVAERLATDFTKAKQIDFSHRYWHLTELWFRRAKRDAEVQRCQLAAAECLITKAESSLEDKKNGYRYAAHWIGQGLEGLRQAKADAARINEVHLRFLELERKSLSELNPLDLDIDKIPGFRESEKQVQEAAKNHVRGLDFEKALARLVHVAKPTDVVALRKQVEAQSEKFIGPKIFGAVALDYSGKVADTFPPEFGSSDINEVSLRKRMIQSAKMINWPMQVVWRIEPARSTIINEHPIRWRDLVLLVSDNPFIPSGHEGIYLRGIQSGFFGDWLAAMHLLIPQLEASFRYVFQQRDIVTSKLEQNGIQKERDLNELLWMPEFEDIFGANLTFDLRGILIESFGCNMRNESAHGLMPEGAFYQPAAVYLWWLALRLCWTGYQFTRPET